MNTPASTPEQKPAVYRMLTGKDQWKISDEYWSYIFGQWRESMLTGFISSNDVGRRLIPNAILDKDGNVVLYAQNESEEFKKLRDELEDAISRLKSSEAALALLTPTAMKFTAEMTEKLTDCQNSNSYLQGELKDANERCIKLKSELDDSEKLPASMQLDTNENNDPAILHRAIPEAEAKLAACEAALEHTRNAAEVHIASRDKSIEELRARPVAEWVLWSSEAPRREEADGSSYVVTRYASGSVGTLHIDTPSRPANTHWLRNCPTLPKQESEAEKTTKSFIESVKAKLSPDVHELISSAIEFALERKKP